MPSAAAASAARSARPSVLTAWSVPASARAAAPEARRTCSGRRPSSPALPRPTATSSGAASAPRVGSLTTSSALPVAPATASSAASSLRRRRRARRRRGRGAAARRTRPLTRPITTASASTVGRRPADGEELGGHVCAFLLVGRARPLRDTNDTGGRPAPAGAGAWVNRWQGARARNARSARPTRSCWASPPCSAPGCSPSGRPRRPRRGGGSCSRWCSPGSSPSATPRRRPTSPPRTRRAAAATSTARHRLCPGAGRLAGVAFLVGKMRVGGRGGRGVRRVRAAVRSRSRPRCSWWSVATALNIAGVRWTARSAYALVGGTLAVLLVVVVVGLSGPRGPTVASAATPGVAAAVDRGGPARRASPPPGWSSSRSPGYARIATLGEEVRDPQRTLRRAVAHRAGRSRSSPTCWSRARCSSGLGPERLATETAPLVALVDSGAAPGAGRARPGRGGGRGRVGAALGAGRDRAARRWPWPAAAELPRALALVGPARHPVAGRPRRRGDRRR